MSWRDRYRTASFRGVEFYVEAHTADRGRRIVTHEFPDREESFSEDLGRRTAEYRVEGYLVGADYDLDRDRLVSACLERGAAELVHPYLGGLEVICVDVSVSESSDQQRTCRVSMLFVDAGVPKFPSADADAVRSVTSSAGAVTGASIAGFVQQFATGGFQSFVAEAAHLAVGGLAGLLERLPINPVAAAQTVAQFVARVAGLRENAIALVASPSLLAGEVSGILTTVRDVYGDRAPAVLTAVRIAYPVLSPAAAGATPARIQERANEIALAALVRQVAIAEQASATVLQAEQSAEAVAAAARDGSGPGATGAVFQTREDAISAREDLTDAVDTELEAAGTTDDVFTALNDLRAKVVNGIPSPEFRLPRVAVVTPPATVPSLVLAYRIYGNAGRAAEIADRNAARHPGFLMGGQPLEVIGDA